MKVIAINGSPNKEGNTHYALNLVADELKNEGIEVKIIHVGNEDIKGCTACFHCMSSQSGECVIKKDKINEWIEKIKQADGIILGSPTHGGGISGTMKNFLDRTFMAIHGSTEPVMRHKVGAAVVTVRRSGEIAALDALNHYFLVCEMMVPSSNYWNIIHGMMPGEAEKDEEGKQTMRILGRNMAYLLKIKEAAKDVKVPEYEPKIMTNFIR